MSSRATPGAGPKRVRRKKQAAARTYAERSSETRERVIQAAIQCIAEDGYKNATVTRIAERSGVSWGGIQHQFGNKASIIQAVLDHALDEFLVGVQRISAQDDKLETRVIVLIQGAWRLVNRPGFLVFLEIVLGHRRGSRRSDPTLRYMARVWKVIIAVWDHLFGDLNLSQEQIETARRVTFAMLGGMAIESTVSRETPEFERSLGVLQTTLLTLLSEPRDISRRR
jgi:AcrR family transcriptional regulator